MADLSAFRSGIDAARSYINNDSHEDPRMGFLNELTGLGYKINSIIEGKIQRFDTPDDDRGDRTGWYIFNSVPDMKDPSKYIGIGVYGSWRDGNKTTWTSRSLTHMSFQDRAAYNSAIESAKAARDAEQEKIYAEAAVTANERWTLSAPPISHPYTDRKGNKIYGIREYNGNLIIPVMANGKIQSLQEIRPDGSKKNWTGGRMKGGYFKLEGDTSTVFVAEGYSTSASIREATGNAVYMAYTASNLYETVSHVHSVHKGSRIVVAGDDDKTGACIGRIKATQAAEAFSAEVLFPPDTNDWNDAHAKHGLPFIKELLTKKPVVAYEVKKTEDKEISEAPPGFLQDLFNFYNATSGNKQPGFAIQTGLALGSIILGRSFKTNMENYSSLYLLNVGKSSTGKEHGKTVIEQVLHESGQGHLVAGDGYTSAGAVFSALLDRPKHICIIDEFGRHLEASKSNGNHHHKEANTKLMEAIGRCHSVMRPSTYSTMSIKKDAADQMKDRRVHNPAITMLTMTTPVTLFNALDITAIQDGFVNRFIINISSAERAVRRHKPPIDVPQKILDWVNTIINRNPIMHLASEVPEAIILNFDESAIALQDEFQQFCVDKANSLEKQGISEITGRSNEMAMRISLIVALSRDPMATNITKEDMAWSIEYVKNCLEKTLVLVRSSMNGSLFEKHKKEVLFALRDSSPEYVRLSSMRKQMPYSQHQKKYLQEILDALVESELADSKQSNGAGRPTLEYIALR